MSSFRQPKTSLLLLMCLSLFCSGLQAEAEVEVEVETEAEVLVEAGAEVVVEAEAKTEAVVEVEVEAEAPTSPNADNTIENLLDFPPIEQFDEVINRPLFIDNRRPLPKAAGPSGGNEKILRETWKLTGIMITQERVLALFSERNGEKRLRLEVGMSLDEHWQLEEVDKNWVSVVSGDESVRLQLRQPREVLPVSSASKTPAGKVPGSSATGNSATGSGPAASVKKRKPAQKSASPPKGKVQTL